MFKLVLVGFEKKINVKAVVKFFLFVSFFRNGKTSVNHNIHVSYSLESVITKTDVCVSLAHRSLFVYKGLT